MLIVESAQGRDGNILELVRRHFGPGGRGSAMRGSLEAQVNLGICYSQGLGVEKNDEEALQWFQKAAEAGHPAGKMNLAISYYEGIVQFIFSVS